MGKIELRKTSLQSFHLSLWDGEHVVRNGRRIFGILETRYAAIPPQYRGLLAEPVFGGDVADEFVIWYSDAFESEPVQLSTLYGQEKERYKAILQEAITFYTQAIASAPGNIPEMMKGTITYHSEDTIYCANDKVVITEWGMCSKKNPVLHTLLSIDYNEKKCDYNQSAGNLLTSDLIEVKEENNESDTVGEWEKRTGISGDGRNENFGNEDIDNSKITDDNNRSHIVDDEGKNEKDNLQNNGQNRTIDSSDDKENQTGSGSSGSEVSVQVEAKPSQKSFFRRFYKLMLVLLLLLLIILVICMVKSCRSNPLSGLPAVSPPLTYEDIGLSPDSLTEEANDRVIILILSGGSLSDFVRDFRRVYPDKDKYQLAGPDTVIPRLVFTMPKEEKQQIIEELPSKFPKYELEILPETIFRNLGMTNDPDMKDERKRWYFDMCGVFNAWDVTMGSEDVVVAVIDDGFDLSHPEIKNKVVKPYNAVQHNTNVFPSQVGHGMHVCATAVGLANNNDGIAGIAPKCRLMPVQVANEQGIMSTSAIIDAVLYALNQGADVVNMSLGMSFGPILQFMPSYMQKNIIANNFLPEERMWGRIFEMADRRNVTFVLAAGNENVLVGLDPMQRSLSTIKVSAVQPNRVKANFSNYGDYSTLSAPGVSIYNALPNGQYGFMDGTSMASPIVAGGVALLKSKNRNMETSEIVEVLERTGQRTVSDIGPIVNFAKALNAPRTDDKDNGGIAKEDECSAISKRYNDLLEELSRLKKEHPECCQNPDTLIIPVGLKVEDLKGCWMSTTRLYNQEEQDVVLYFYFYGTSKGKLEAVEPDKSKFSAPLSVSVKDDVIYIRQISEATSLRKEYNYSPYSFVCKPDRNRRADCKGQNLVNSVNKINFNLIRLNN